MKTYILTDVRWDKQGQTVELQNVVESMADSIDDAISVCEERYGYEIKGCKTHSLYAEEEMKALDIVKSSGWMDLLSYAQVKRSTFEDLMKFVTGHNPTIVCKNYTA